MANPLLFDCALPGYANSFITNHDPDDAAMRQVVLLLLVLLLTMTGVLLLRTSRLAMQLEQQALESQGLRQTDENALSMEALRSVRAELESRLLVAEERVEALEARSDAGRRVIAEAAPSVVFLQRSYGFVDASGRPLRMVLDPDGRPITDLQGNPRGSLSGAGPVLEPGRAGSGNEAIAQTGYRQAHRCLYAVTLSGHLAGASTN